MHTHDMITWHIQVDSDRWLNPHTNTRIAANSSRRRRIFEPMMIRNWMSECCLQLVRAWHWKASRNRFQSSPAAIFFYSKWSPCLVQKKLIDGFAMHSLPEHVNSLFSLSCHNVTWLELQFQFGIWLWPEKMIMQDSWVWTVSWSDPMVGELIQHRETNL